jgi:GT2 family glycosyltransferase
MKKLALIIVAYNTPRLAESLVSTILEWSTPLNCDIFLCDNSPQSAIKMKSQGGLKVFHYEDNPGYFGAAQRVYKAEIESGSYDYVGLLNADLRLQDKNFFKNLAAIEKEADLGVLAPDVRSELSGQRANPYMRVRPSQKKMRFYKKIYANETTARWYHTLSLYKARTLRLLKPTSRTGETEQTIYAAHGCAMFFTDSYFRSGGDFQHPVFLYNEEITVAEHCRHKNLKTLYVPQLRLAHIERASTGTKISPATLGFLKQASAYAYDTFFK